LRKFEKKVRMFFKRSQLANFVCIGNSTPPSHSPNGEMPRDKQCDKCDYMTNDKRNLTRHMETMHLGLKKAQCDICGKQFSEKKKMKSHVETQHLGLKKAQCPQCGFRAASNHQISRHIREGDNDKS
jgi:uncharacterized C2H2 Zn-finger protein